MSSVEVFPRTKVCQWPDRFSIPTLKLGVRGERGLHSTSIVKHCCQKKGVYIHWQTFVRHLSDRRSATCLIAAFCVKLMCLCSSAYPLVYLLIFCIRHGVLEADPTHERGRSSSGSRDGFQSRKESLRGYYDRRPRS